MKTFKAGDIVWVRATYEKSAIAHYGGGRDIPVHVTSVGNKHDDDIRADVPDYISGAMSTLAQANQRLIERAEKAEAERDALKQENASLSENLFITNKHACDLQATVARVEALAHKGIYTHEEMWQALHPEPTALELLERIENEVDSGQGHLTVLRNIAALRKLLEKTEK